MTAARRPRPGARVAVKVPVKVPVAVTVTLPDYTARRTPDGTWWTDLGRIREGSPMTRALDRLAELGAT